MRYVLMAMMFALTSLYLNTAQAANDQEKESLQGLPGVLVVIENLQSNIQADGLTQEAIRTAVELILRSSGIKVLTSSEAKEATSIPFLYVQVVSLKDNPPLQYALHIRVQVTQYVSLIHRPTIMYATTWDRGQTVIVGTNRVRDVTSSTIEPMVKAFANDFLAVNPR